MMALIVYKTHRQFRNLSFRKCCPQFNVVCGTVLHAYGLTKSKVRDTMETKKGYFVSSMRDKIVEASIEALRNEGLKFSVDTLADSDKVKGFVRKNTKNCNFR